MPSGKYGYISSKKLGASCGTPAHIPLAVTGPCRVVRVTEGELKAEVATELSGVPTISCGSVNSWRVLIEPLHALQASQVLLAFDADSLTNDKVAKQLVAAHKGLTDEGFAVDLEWWEGEHKGIDDLLFAGRQADVLTGQAVLDKLQQLSGIVLAAERNRERRTKVKATAATDDDDGPPFDEHEARLDPDDVLWIDSRETPTRATFAAITSALLKGDKTYLRTSQPVYIDGDNIRAILETTDLAAIVNTIVEVRVVAKTGCTYEPLPAKYGGPWLAHPLEIRRLPEIRVFTRHPIFDAQGNLVSPGYHADTGVYYSGPEIIPSESCELLTKLLAEFCWRTPADRTNFLAVLLTPFFADRFIGSKPALLLNGNQPGLGKSILAQIVAILRDGKPVISATYNPNDEEFEKTLGARVREGITTIIVDNAKTNARSPTVNSAVLERSITDRELSFRLLGQSANIRAENSHQFVLTANSAEVSPDLMSRSIVVGLFLEGDPRRRKFAIPNIEDFCQANRNALLGELAGLVQQWFRVGQPRVEVSTRFEKSGWGSTIGGILQAAGEPDFYSNQDDVAAEMDRTLADFRQLIESMTVHDQGSWTAAELVRLAADDKLFEHELAGRNDRGKATVIGTIAGRFLGDTFSIRGSDWVFQKQSGVRITHYVVRNLSPESVEETAELF